MIAKPIHPTVRTILEEWLQTKKPRVSVGSYKTYSTYLNSILLPRLGHLPLKELTADHVTELLKNANVASRTARSVKRLLSNALDMAVQQGILGENPCQSLELPERKETRYYSKWTAVEQERFISVACASRFYAAYLFAIHARARLGEVLALQWQDVDFTNGFVTFSKQVTDAGSGKMIMPVVLPRRAELPSDVLQKLRVLKGTDQPTELIAKTKSGKHIYPHNFYRDFRQLSELALLPAIRFKELSYFPAT